MRKNRTNRVKRTKGRSNNRTKSKKSKRTSKSKKSRTKKSLKSNTDLKKFKKLEKKLEKLYMNNASKKEIDKTSKQLANLQKKMIKANKKRMKGGAGIQERMKAANEQHLNKTKLLIIKELKVLKESEVEDLDLTAFLESAKMNLLKPQTSATMADKGPDHNVTQETIKDKIIEFIDEIKSMSATELGNKENMLSGEVDIAAASEKKEEQPNPGDAQG